MNERIRELAEQAGMVKTLEEHAREYGNGMFENTPYPELEYLAELIVKECAEIADNADATREKWQSIGKFVREHFGVEE